MAAAQGGGFPSIHGRYPRKFVLLQTPKQKADVEAIEKKIRDEQIQIQDNFDRLALIYGLSNAIPRNTKNGMCAFLECYKNTSASAIKEDRKFKSLGAWIAYFNDMYSSSVYEVPNTPFKWYCHIFQDVYKLQDGVSHETLPRHIIEASNELVSFAFPDLKF